MPGHSDGATLWDLYVKLVWEEVLIDDDMVRLGKSFGPVQSGLEGIYFFRTMDIATHAPDYYVGPDMDSVRGYARWSYVSDNTDSPETVYTKQEIDEVVASMEPVYDVTGPWQALEYEGLHDIAERRSSEIDQLVDWLGFMALEPEADWFLNCLYGNDGQDSGQEQ